MVEYIKKLPARCDLPRTNPPPNSWFGFKDFKLRSVTAKFRPARIATTMEYPVGRTVEV
jgi:hypothetical protein